jgi:hypothetical protein
VYTTSLTLFKEKKRKRMVSAGSSRREYSTGDDFAEWGEADWSTEPSGSSSSTKDGSVESSQRRPDRGRESGSIVLASSKYSGIPREGSKVGDREADWIMESSESRPSTNDGSIESREKSVESSEGVRVSRNKIAAASLMASLRENWREGIPTATSALVPLSSEVGGRLLEQVSPEKSSCEKNKRPEGVSDNFLKAVDETVLLVQNYFAPSGGDGWPSVAEPPRGIRPLTDGASLRL